MIIRFYAEAIESVYLKAWETQLVREFGGLTKYRTQGGFLDNGKLVFENSFVFEVVTEQPIDVASYGEILRQILGQSQVLVTTSEVSEVVTVGGYPKPTPICAWCYPGFRGDNLTHGVCVYHTAEILKDIA